MSRPRALDAASAQLDPRAGALVRLVWLESEDGADDRLLLVVHHLCVDAVSWPILYVVSAWTCIAFFLTGVNSRFGPATLAVATLGAFCVASAIFLILELSQPYTSSIRVSSEGIDRVALELEKP